MLRCDFKELIRVFLMFVFVFFHFSFRYQPKITLDELINLLKFDDIDHARDFIKSSGKFYDVSTRY